MMIDPWPRMFAFDLFRYAIPASLAFVVFWVWKWDALVHRRIQKRRPKRKALAREVAYSMSTIVIFSIVGVTTLQLGDAGILQRYNAISTYGWPYWFASIGLAILIHDTYFYWTHRAMHHPWLYRHMHRVHHLSTSPSPWAAYAFAPLEAVIEALVAPLVFLLIPMHPIAMFMFLMYMIVINVLGHLGIELYPRWFARARWTRWLTTSTHHNIHHRDFHGNYGLYFTWWDRVMRTQHAEYHQTFDAVTASPSPPTGAPRYDSPHGARSERA